MIIPSICRLGKKGANIIFYKGDSWNSLARVEGHLQLGLEHRKCDGLCSVSNKCFILIKIMRFKLHVLKYSECIFFSLKRTDYCTPNSTSKSLLESTSFFFPLQNREKETNLLFSLVFMALRVKGKRMKIFKNDLFVNNPTLHLKGTALLSFLTINYKQIHLSFVKPEVCCYYC